jgi:hypothetical protein
MGWTSPAARELFNSFARYEAEKHRIKREQFIDAVKTAPMKEGVMACIERCQPLAHTRT